MDGPSGDEVINELSTTMVKDIKDSFWSIFEQDCVLGTWGEPTILDTYDVGLTNDLIEKTWFQALMGPKDPTYAQERWRMHSPDARDPRSPAAKAAQNQLGHAMFSVPSDYYILLGSDLGRSPVKISAVLAETVPVPPTANMTAGQFGLTEAGQKLGYVHKHPATRPEK